MTTLKQWGRTAAAGNKFHSPPPKIKSFCLHLFITAQKENHQRVCLQEILSQKGLFRKWKLYASVKCFTMHEDCGSVEVIRIRAPNNTSTRKYLIKIPLKHLTCKNHKKNSTDADLCTVCVIIAQTVSFFSLDF